MSICRASLIALLLGTAAGGAAAQETPAPDAPLAAPVQESPPPPAKPQFRGVVASELSEVDPFVIGGLADGEPGLPSTLWANSDLAAVAEAASRAPGETGFLAASTLAARTLLTPGPSPSGSGDRREATRERLTALLGLGRVDAVDSIVTQLPSGLDEPEFAALAVRARLARGEIVPACRVGDALTNGRDGAFWLRLRAACYAWADESAAAQLTLDLAREADPQVADEDFTNWVFAAASHAAPEHMPAPRDALESALAQSAGYTFDAETLDRLPLLVAVGLLRDEDIGADVRAEAARRAARVGAASAGDLAAALAEVSVPPSAAPSALIAAATEESFPQADADLHRAATAKAASPYEAAEALDAALARAETPADFILTARGLKDVLESLPASADLVEHAPRFVLAAAALGDERLAYAWLDPRAPGLSAPSGFDDGAAASAAGFTPILNTRPDFSRSPIEPTARIAAEAVVAAAEPGASPQRLADAARARLQSTADAGDAEQAFARRDALLLLALGAQVSPELRRAASAAVSEAYPAADAAGQALAAARLAADAGAVGETALYLAQATGAVGPGHAPTIASAIEIARQAGLDDDARALAVEAMLASRVAGAGGAGTE